MKILCVSDYVDPLIYNQNVKEAFPDIDLILCAGDLPMVATCPGGGLWRHYMV